MRVSRLFLCAAVLLLPSAPLARSAQGPQSSADAASKLESVRITGSSRFSSDQILAAIRLRPGTMVTRDDIQKAANDLAQLGVFSNVEYRYETVDTGVRAEYTVKDAPGIPVSFDNFPWFTDQELAAAIEKAGVLFDGMAPAHGTVLDAMSNALGQLVASRGAFGGVSHTLTTEPLTGGQMQQFHVEQPDLKIASVEFSDAIAQASPAVRTRLADLIGQPFSRSAIELFEVEQVRPAYFAHGYLRVRFGAPVTRIAEGAKNVSVVVSIQPGPQFVWNGVLWIGNSAISTLDLEQAIPFHQGDPANGTEIEAAWDRVRAAYHHIGYLTAQVDPAPRFDEASHQAAYTVRINEGPQYRMGKLVLTGLSTEGERRIRAGWRIPAGNYFDQTAYDEFLNHGITQAFAGLPVHYEKIGHFLQTDAAASTVDVMIDFQ